MENSNQTKYIFITGGVVSSLGKGIASTTIGTLLESRGIKIDMLKFDPYINLDPGTMSPLQHGKLFVTDGRQVSIWSITGEIPTLEREISTSYKVQDLEVSDGVLYVYEEEYYWYWFWLRKHTKFEVIELGVEAGDEVVTYTDDVDCGDSEMMQDLDAVYLGCTNGQHRINKEDGTALSEVGGEKNYFRDSYSYRDDVYQTFSGAVHLSK